MNSPHLKPSIVSKLKSRPFIVIAALGLIVVLLAVIFWPRKAETGNNFYTVRRGDFLISVVEGGTIQAVNEVSIRNEVEGTSRIIYIVPEGSYVKKGQLLVELDSAAAQDEVNQQLIAVEKAQFALIQAQEQLEIQQSIVDSEIRAAELKLEFAEKDLEKFKEGEALQELRKAENDVTSGKEKLAIDKDRFEWSKKLHDQGFESKSNLDRDQLTMMQSQLSLEMATNSLWMIKAYDHPKKLRQFESAVEEAAAELKRVNHQGERKLAQFKADVRTQEITLELNKSRLERNQRQLDAAKIYAPQDGLVVYQVSENRFSSESLIEEGATVRNRQTLIKLPDTSAMKLGIKIHESHINMIQPGQPAYVVLDSMPDQRFNGFVSKVALLPDTSARWGNPNLKVYATEIMVKDHLPDVKPGVSARAEVVITNLQNVISVPLQAVTTRQGKPVVYLASSGGAKPVKVEVGLYNTKFIEVISGLKEGDRILLSPPFDTQQKDLGGAIVGEGEGITISNQVPVAPSSDMTSQEGPRMRRDIPGEGGAEAGIPPGEGRNGGGEGRRDGLSREGGAGPQAPGGGGQRADWEALRTQYDKDGDGELNEEERSAMRAAMQQRFGEAGGRRGPGAVEGGADSPNGEGERGGGRRRPRGEEGGAPNEGPRRGGERNVPVQPE